jgi:hypothetical protein
MTIRQFFKHCGSGEATAYRRFAEEVVEPGDVILTFNYDPSLERELKRVGKWEVGDGYGFRIDVATPQSKTKVLKLHGSTNWISVLMGGLSAGGVMVLGGSSPFGDRPVIPPDEMTLLGYEGVLDPKFHSRAGFVHILILPTFSKRFYFSTNLGYEWADFWDSLWRRAASRLRETTEVVIAGYSFPAADSRAEQLVLGNLRPDCRVTLGCMSDNPKLRERFKAHGFGNVVLIDGRFEDWIASRR